MSVGSGAGLTGTVVIFLGHGLSIESCRAFQRLKSTAGPGVTVRWLLDNACKSEIPAGLAGEVLEYDSSRFAGWGYAVMGTTMLPGHCHFPLLQLYEENPGIERLWLVEYDAHFTGRWSVLFEHFANDDADLLTCHVKTWDQEPRWHWWNTLAAPERSEPVDIQRVRAFLVVARYSAAALRLLAQQHRAGWIGHQEVVVPSLLLHHGLTVRDLNHAGPARAARRFYLSVSDPEGKLEEFGTLRYRPSRIRAGFRRNTLYHPVKPSSMIRTRSFLTALLRKFAVARHALFGR